MGRNTLDWQVNWKVWHWPWWNVSWEYIDYGWYRYYYRSHFAGFGPFQFHWHS